MRLLSVLLLMLLIVIAGCVIPPTKPVLESPKIVDTDMVLLEIKSPSLLLLTEKSIQGFDISNPADPVKKFELPLPAEFNQETAKTSGRIKFRDNKILFSDYGTIYIYDIAKAKLVTYQANHDILDFEAKGDILLALTNDGSLRKIHLEKKQEETLSLELDEDFSDQPKSGHNIIISDGRAYILDNFVYPLFILALDLNDSSNEFKKLKFETINGHLEDQAAANGQLYVIESTVHQGGKAIYIDAIDLKSFQIQNSSAVFSCSIEYYNPAEDQYDNCTYVDIKGILVENNLAYLAGKDAFVIWDMKNKTVTNIVKIDEFGGRDQDINIVKNRQYVYLISEKTLTILDISDTATIKIVKKMPFEESLFYVDGYFT